MDTQWRHKSKISEKLGRCSRENMLRPYLKIWEWEWIFGRAVKAISSPGVRSPCSDRFLKLDKERFPPRSNLTRNKALEKKEDKTISLICSSFFQMIKRRKMMSSLIPCLSSASVLALSSCCSKFNYEVFSSQKYSSSCIQVGSIKERNRIKWFYWNFYVNMFLKFK